MNLSRPAVQRPIGTLMIYGIVLLIGLVSLASLPIDLLPDISFPTLSVSTEYSGAGPEVVENLVTRVLEEALSTVAGVQDIVSTSSEGGSRVTITFPYGTNLDAAMADVRAVIERARRRLPDGVDTPGIFRFDPSQFPIMQLGIVGREQNDLGLVELRQVAEDQLLFRLERIPGVAQVSISGGLRRQVFVELDRVRMQALAISEREVIGALTSTNLVAAGGRVTEGARRLGLRILSEYRDVGQIRRTVVAVRDGAPIFVGDIAAVAEGAEEQTGLVRINGRPGVLVSVQRQAGTNTVAVSNRVRREVASVGAALPDASVLVLNDSARFIRRSIRSVQQAVLIGGGLAIAVLLLFLRDLRTVLIIATAIPISVVASFALMFFLGYSLNLMTLGAMALAVGMLVDAAIVVLENIFRHRESGRSGTDAASAATQEVTSAIVASTLTTVVVFLPVVFMRGGAITTQLFFQFSVVVVVALMCSLAVALTLVPSLAAHLPRMARAATTTGWFDRLLPLYREALRWALRHRRTVFVVSAVVFALGLGSLALLGREVIPEADEGEIFVFLAMPTGTRLELTTQAVTDLERAAREAAPEITTITASSGGAAFGGSGSHRGSLRLRLADRGDRSRSTEAVAAVLRRQLQVPGGRVFIRPSAGALSFLRFGGADPVAVEIRGHDLDRALAVGQQVREILEAVPGITDAAVSREERVPEVVVRIDAERAVALGLTPAQISTALRTAVAGSVATILREGGREQDVVVRLSGGDRLASSEVLALPLITPSGRRIALGQVAQLVRGEAPTSIFRVGRQRVTTVTAGISGRDFGSVMADVRARLAALPLPDGFSIALGDEYEQQQAAYRQLGLGFVVALLLVYAVMAIQFEALLEPLLIMGAVPFALSGALLTLFLTDTTLNIQSLIGLIVLTGVIVNNAIVLITFILDLRRRDGLPLHEAAVTGATTRLRPVLMTTITTVVGLLPVAIGFGEGAELQVPLARSVLGGLLLGTLVTLIFIPTLYVAVEEFRQRRIGRKVEALLKEPASIAGGENGEHLHSPPHPAPSPPRGEGKED